MGDVFEGFHTTSVALDYVNTLWDAGKSRACLCDPMYTEVDCSRKMCSKGNDVLDTRSDTTDDLVYQVQNITINVQTDETGEVDNGAMNSSTFALIFKTALNETYKTTPIVYSWNRPERPADAIEEALLALPNNAIDGVYVNSSSISGVGTSLGITRPRAIAPWATRWTRRSSSTSRARRSRARRICSWLTSRSAKTAARRCLTASTSRRTAARSRPCPSTSRRITTTTSAAAVASATMTRVSVTALRATPATSARCRPRSSKPSLD